MYEADESDVVAPNELALQRRRYERNNAFLFHSVKVDEAAGEKPLADSSREGEPPSDGVDVAVVSAAARPGALDTADYPKLLSPLAGEPMLGRVLRQLKRGGIRRVIIILGSRGEQVVIRSALDR